MATKQDTLLQKFFEVLNASKLPSELTELLSSPSSDYYSVIQSGTSDAMRISVPRLRGSLGTYNANSNTPKLINGTGVEGDSYVVTVAGTRDFGAGAENFLVNDVVSYRNGKWIKTGFKLTEQLIVDTLGYTPEDTANKGQALGYAPLNSNTKVDAIYLPAFVDEVIEGTYVNSTTFNDSAGNPVTPSGSKIYVDTTSSISYRWGGTVFVDIKSSPGTTDDVAEGTLRLYFTEPRVLATTLSGLAKVNTAIVDGDSVIAALGKAQGQIDELNATVNNQNLTAQNIIDALTYTPANDSEVVKSVSVNGGTAQTPDVNGNVDLGLSFEEFPFLGQLAYQTDLADIIAGEDRSGYYRYRTWSGQPQLGFPSGFVYEGNTATYGFLFLLNKGGVKGVQVTDTAGNIWTKNRFGINEYWTKNSATQKEHEISGVRRDASVSAVTTIDWNAITFQNITITDSTTLTDANLPTGNNTKVIEMLITGDFALTLPAYWEAMPGNDTYDGTVRNHFVVTCVKGDSGTEDVIYQLTNMAV